MGLTITAILALLLAVLRLLPLPADAVPANFWLVRDIALALLCALMAVQAFAARRAPATPPPPPPPPPPPEPKPQVVAAPPPPPPRQEPVQTGEALMLLALLQDKGRFLDYVMEDISAYGDAQVAAASRVVHQGCAAVIREYLAVEPAHGGKEGERISVDKDADPNRYRMIGKLAGEPPFSGVIVHRGWKTSKLALPRHTRPIDPKGENLITPVEVEVH
ncbi:MAG: DUF2760 domain-containing protein [Rhodocyclaceae bacterium]|nr:DUF2760 domain-containing protein [Rhodocyclaceae bacterium]MBX3670040.1 DUF2760 domain-containing protein [Rhodocyclaceae bacterium]